MGQADLELGVAVQHAAENEVAGGDGGIERIAQQVGKVKGLQALSADGGQRVQENGEAQGLDAGKNGLEQGIVEVVFVDVGAQIDAFDAGQLAGAVELVLGAVRIEHGQGDQGDQAVGIGLVGGAGAVVPGLAKIVRKVGAAPVAHGSGEGDGLHGDSLP